jgi:hypothetical protein
LASISLAARRFNAKKATGAFADPAVTEHPIYYRVMQAYLALCAEVDTTVAEATCVERQGAPAVFLPTW